VFTGWRHLAAPLSAPAGTISALKLKVARPIGGATYMIVGDSAVESTVPGTLNVFSTRIPVEAGDVIGFHVVDNGACLRNIAGYGSDEVMGDPAPGSTVTLDNPFASQLDVSAILEPDCDRDGFGDETQDPELPFSEACGKGNRSLAFDANKNKVKKGKKVTLSGRLTTAARQGPCDSGQTVELQRKKPSQSIFATFAQIQTDSQGNFSLKKKIKKTFEFRAQVVETAACTAALSNSEKVKAKKRRK
jgi:hypothetical protein